MDLKLRSYREATGLTQQELAEQIGKSFRTIQSWERGMSYPNAESLIALCNLFDVDPNTMLGWYDTHPREEAPPIAPDEAAVVEGYRSCTPEWKRHVRMDVEAAAGASLKSAESPAPIEMDSREAV